MQKIAGPLGERLKTAIVFGACRFLKGCLYLADQFKAYFERFGTISDAQIMQDHTSGRSRGFG